MASLSATAPPTARNTPLRAIPSRIAVKSAPTIPPPTDAYEPHVKTVLRHRLLYNIFLHSGLVTWAIASFSVWWQQNSLLHGVGQFLVVPFRPSTLLASMAIWCFMALPVIVLRKFLLTPTRTTTTSPASSLATALAKPSIRRALGVYASSAITLVLIHTAMAYGLEKVDPKLGFFVKSRKHPHYLNGRFIFLVISQLVVGLSYGFRSVMLDRFAFKWNIASQKDETHSKLTFSDIVRAAIVSAVLSAMVMPVTASVFALTRLFLPIVYKLPILPSFLKPFTAHFLRGSWTIVLPFSHINLICRAFCLGFISFFTWEILDTLFDLNVAKRIPVAYLTADPNQTLISGISSQDATFQYFAYSELCSLAEDKSASAIAQRGAFFADQKYSPSLWAHFIRESLLLLGKDYQLFLRSGNPEPPPTTVPSTAPATPAISIPSTPVPVLRQGIFKYSANDASATTSDAKRSNGLIPRAVEVSTGIADLPQIFRSVEVKPAPEATREAQKTAETPKDYFAPIKQKVRHYACAIYKMYVPPVVVAHLQSWMSWWKNDRTQKAIEKCLPSRELDIIVIEVISRFTCASLTEDRYGVVQRDIPRILEAFLSFLSAVEERQIKVNSLCVAPKPEDKMTPKEIQEHERLRYEVEKAGEVLGAVADGLKEGVARIVRTFGDKLFAFKFPPRTAQKLQGFLDYC
ncbi:hypothetical protein AGABI1DRAFT_116372 [Agaricus bisporus var. burnettii JB137-S8]|uniref:Nucleoporin NDC1 n=1 Tax=Agaricus bisporus var. burnettii (strain JB137-S8 / ATCC MYA-4627 / FGSC 10392) TaxID=597362 RepID=K5XLL3_AGABU|nr:uncharacterized protein AGABI1DRAFT_116372 [Agaricus bisporus var. burnettii JB137-S8]EKM75430.1 hypothetical protein AGABI1DRAFT_116372 [Agaricus bisporus var. burnettii JB137-S8]